jgi:chromosome segregation ATPase
VLLRNEVMEQNERIRSAEADKLDLENDIHQLKDGISAKKAEGERELRKKERMEKEMLELKRTLDNRTYEIKQKQTLVAQGEDQILRLEHMLKEQRGNTDKAQREYNNLNEKVQKLHRDLEEQIHTNTQLLAENSQKQVELKVKEDEIQSIKVRKQNVGGAVSPLFYYIYNQRQYQRVLDDDNKCVIINLYLSDS